MTTTASLLSAAGSISRLSRSASRVVGKPAGGFHLLRVEAYSQTKTLPAGQSITSTRFSIGKYKWYFKYYPNGRDTSTNSDYISLYLKLHGQRQLQAQYKMSILDQAGNIAYGLPAKTELFKREDLIMDDCLVFRCDVGGFTDLDISCLARDESDSDDGVKDDDEYGLKPQRPGSSSSRRRRRPDDSEFIQWCLAQKRMG
ncbi:hypothetical protein VPH35_113787 [Triticum aestivum]